MTQPLVAIMACSRWHELQCSSFKIYFDSKSYWFASLKCAAFSCYCFVVVSVSCCRFSFSLLLRSFWVFFWQFVFQNGFHRETSPQIQQIYSSTITISKTMYDTDSDVNNEMNTARSPYNSLSRSSKSPYSSSSLQQQQHNTQFNSQVNSGGNNRHTGIAASPSLVSDNLCELDNLLDDLSESTKQYSLSRDRKTRGTCL